VAGQCLEEKLNISSRSVTGILVAIAVMVATLAAVTGPASAVTTTKSSGRHFKVVQTFQKAKLGVCKVSNAKKTAWRVYGRLDTHKVRVGKFAASLYVYQDGKTKPYARWQSPMTKKGKYSKVGSVRVPNKPGYSLQGGIGGGNMGDGGVIKISRVHKC